MNAVELINKLKQSFNTPSVYDGDVYENWNSTEVKYSSINISIENINYNSNVCTYTILFYYGDRLLQDKSNFNAIITDGVNTIQSVINNLNNEYIFNVEDSIDYTIFEQKFNDYLAGVYCRVMITTDSTIGICSIEE